MRKRYRKPKIKNVSGYWIAQYRDRDGGKCRRSLGPVDKVRKYEAEKKLAKILEYRNKATDQLIFLGRTGVELIDLDGGKPVRHCWIRGGCQYGVMPANGLLYLPAHSCACYIQSKLSGFWALAPTHIPHGSVDLVRTTLAPATLPCATVTWGRIVTFVPMKASFLIKTLPRNTFRCLGSTMGPEQRVPSLRIPDDVMMFEPVAMQAQSSILVEYNLSQHQLPESNPLQTKVIKLRDPISSNLLRSLYALS